MLELTPESWEILPSAHASRPDELVRVPDSFSAEDFLRPFKSNFMVMLHLRGVLSATEPVSRIDDDALIRLISARLAGGELVLRNTGPREKKSAKAESTEEDGAAASTRTVAWLYSQSSGRLTHDGEMAGTGYSGTGKGRNNPGMEDHQNLGPIPRGRYRIGRAYDTASHGPHVMALTPIEHNARGRSGFLIHGDNRRHDASKGCIILPRDIRDRISSSGDDVLEVVP